jgi:hypothetical protein
MVECLYVGIICPLIFWGYAVPCASFARKPSAISHQQSARLRLAARYLTIEKEALGPWLLAWGGWPLLAGRVAGWPKRGPWVEAC